MSYIDVTGKTEEEAIRKALQQLQMDRDDVSVEILERAKSGFLGIGSSPARVRVTYGQQELPPSRSSRRRNPKRSPNPSPSRNPSSPSPRRPRHPRPLPRLPKPPRLRRLPPPRLRSSARTTTPGASPSS